MSQRSSGSERLGFATGTNAAFIESLYVQFKKDPESVDQSWRRFFEGYEFAAFGDKPPVNADDVIDSAKMEGLINAYRRLGHLSADLNPLEKNGEIGSNLDPAYHGLVNIDPARTFQPSNLPEKALTYAEILSLLQDTYCGRIGADFREINNIEAVLWFQQQMEGCRNRPTFPESVRRRVFDKLVQAEGFETFLQRRHLGKKRFSLEGLDALIPMLDVIASDAAASGVEEVCLGMAHRGRLNVLANFMGKSYESMLKEFEGTEFNPFDIDGDVKYHMGFASEIDTGSGKLRLYLSPNPSHLEFVNPVVEGFVRARQRLLNDEERTRIMPLLMHGDAAFIGQGIVAETLNLSQLEAYKTGGTIHIITNNQIGFTTEPEEGRSTRYSSEIAKMIRAPVLHVNADDPEAAIWCAQLAVAFRQKYRRDIVIDLIGYRRHGHNEGDEPAFTQPLMYKTIKDHPTVLTRYTERLVAEKVLTAAEAEAANQTFRDTLQAAYDVVHGKTNPKLPAPVVPVSLQKAMTYKRATRDDVAVTVKTGVKVKVLREIAQTLTQVPKTFHLNKKLQRLLDQRLEMMDGDGSVDWGFGELLAFGSLARDGHHIRISGQDSKRGTFSSRQSIFRDEENGEYYEPLNHISGDQGHVHIINSPLSEQGVLGFEFGYSVADKEALVCWEAQFGDFANGAQIIIDQFLSASEAKWKQTCSLVLLLPHGHEGQGPEHSSARPERFLQLCGNMNLQVVYPTTPSQYFHVLRRQLARDFQKPLIVMTPKSLLRDKLVRSPLANFESSYFEEVIDDESVANKKDVTRLILCSGKIYYDLIQARAENEKAKDVPILRLEQFYPFPYDRVKEIFALYPKLKEIVWTQEEPQNMGGFNFARGRFLEVMKSTQTFGYVGRKNSGTPAEGSTKAHEIEQQRIVHDALGLACGWTPQAVSKA